MNNKVLVLVSVLCFVGAYVTNKVDLSSWSTPTDGETVKVEDLPDDLGLVAGFTEAFAGDKDQAAYHAAVFKAWLDILQADAAAVSDGKTPRIQSLSALGEVVANGGSFSEISKKYKPSDVAKYNALLEKMVTDPDLLPQKGGKITEEDRQKIIRLFGAIYSSCAKIALGEAK